MAFVTETAYIAEDRIQLRGIGFGLIAAGAWAFYTVASRIAVETGFNALDMTAIRYVVAALVFLPFLFRQGLVDLGGVGWGRGALLALGAGPLFSLFYVYGLSVTPYAHGPVVSPSTVTLASMFLAAVFLGERISAIRMAAALTVIGGLYLVVSGGSDLLRQASPHDLFFVFSGFLWAVFTILLRRWRLDPILATGSVSLISGIVMFPILVYFADWNQLTSNLTATAFHAIMQGVVAAAVAVVAFSKAVLHLGASKAGLFPSIVPILAVLLGVPFLAEIPSMVQSIGIAVATAGLLLTALSR